MALWSWWKYAEPQDATRVRDGLIGQTVRRFASEEAWVIEDVFGFDELPSMVSVFLRKVDPGDGPPRHTGFEVWMPTFQQMAEVGENPVQVVSNGLDFHLRGRDRQAWIDAHAVVATAHAHSRWIAA